MSSLRGSNLVFHLTISIESDLIPCLDHPDSHFSKPPPVGPAALRLTVCSESCCAQFPWYYVPHRDFLIGKLSLSLKRLKERNYERNYWVNTLMPIIFSAVRDPDEHPVWNCLYQERKALLIPLLPNLAMTHLAHDLPYQRSTIITKLKEPTVLLTKKSCSALRWPAGKKPKMNLREYLHKYDIVPWLWVKGH